MATPEKIDIFYFLFIGTIAIFILTGGVVVFFMTYQRRLFAQQLKLQEANQQHQENLLQATIENIEKERQRIAKDLHDEAGNLLSTIKFKLNQAAGEYMEHTDYKAIIIHCKSLTDDCAKSLKRISYNIIPPGLELFGLLACVEDLCTQINTENGLEVKLETTEQQIELNTEKALSVYRIVQELSNNTLKHAGAKKITIHISQQENQLQLQYADDGKGFDLPEENRGKSLGLKNMESRAHFLKGTIQFDTALNKGFTAQLNIPIAHEQKN